MAFPPTQPPADAMIGAGPSSPGSAMPNALAGGAGPLQPPTTPSGIPCLPRPQLEMSPADVKAWWKRWEDDKARRELEKPKWGQLLRAYFPPNYGSDYTDLNSNIHFRNVHMKTSELWGQFPDLILTPRDPLKGVPQIGPNGQPQINPQTGQPVMASPDDIVAIKRAFLNHDLGPDGADVDQTVRQALFDVFMTSGIGPSKICYEADVKYVAAEPAAPIPGAILGLSTPPEPQPVVVNERRRWYHFPADQLLIPSTFRSTDWDRAPYLGMEFEEPFTENARKAYNLPDDYRPTTSANNDRPLASDADRAAANAQKVIKGVEFWLHAAEFDPNEVDKDVFYRLVLIEGLKDRAAVYELSPYQDKGMNGRLTSDSMIGNPIHPFCLRVASDTAWVPSDAAFTNPLVNIANRDAKWDALRSESNTNRFFHAASLSAPVDKLRDAGMGQGVAVDDAIMARGKNNLMWEIPHLDQAQSDAQAHNRNQQAITETLGLGANSGGAYNDTRKSATETAVVQQNMNARLQGERLVLLALVIKGVRKYDALVQRYETTQGYVQVVGPYGAQVLTPYTNAHLAGRFAYDARPDSQLTIDQATRIKRVTDFENFYAKSPAADQWGMFRQGCVEFGYPVSTMLKPPPTTAPPPPMSMSIDLSSANLAENLMLPEVRTILQTHGVPLSPQPSPEAAVVAAANRAKEAATHGGGAPQADKVEKHKAEETGNQVGTPPLAGHPAQPPPGAVNRMVQ